jgi:hypothetical protein
VDVVRAWDEFVDLAGTRHDHGRMSWRRGPGPAPIREGDELSPVDTVGSVKIGGEDGVSMHIGMDSFGAVRRLLVKEGEEVRPGQPLMEYEPRTPTTEEWYTERRLRRDAEFELRRRKHDRRNPASAAWASIRERLRR